MCIYIWCVWYSICIKWCVCKVNASYKLTLLLHKYTHNNLCCGGDGVFRKNRNFIFFSFNFYLYILNSLRECGMRRSFNIITFQTYNSWIENNIATLYLYTKQFRRCVISKSALYRRPDGVGVGLLNCSSAIAILSYTKHTTLYARVHQRVSTNSIKNWKKKNYFETIQVD